MKNSDIATISFQYLAHGAQAPSAGYKLTDVAVTIQPGMPIPRVGEIVSHQIGSTMDMEPFLVLSVHYSILRNLDNHQELLAWHVTVTLGDIPKDMDSRLLYIRE